MEFTGFTKLQLFTIEYNIFWGEDHAIYLQSVGNLNFQNFSFCFNSVMDNTTSS